MTYEEAKLYIEEIGQTGSILGLEQICNLMRELGDIQEKQRIIHIGGTNGKGSVGAFIESILIEAGYRVGRYTSPAVFEPFEVWRMNQKNITLEDYLDCLEEVKAACERMLCKGMAQPTVFEVETALAFVYFYKKHCEYVLLEVGMGGETDATNLITKPVCSVLTSISMDHMQFLGNSLEEITHVKSGIIKRGCPIVTGSTQKPEILQIIKEVANQKQAEVFLTAEILPETIERGKSGISYQHQWVGTISLPMLAEYQVENSNLAITVCHKVLGISKESIQAGINKTKWNGRFEVISQNPYIVLDGAHNEDAAKKIAKDIENHFTNRKIAYIIGVLADKEYQKMLEVMLPYAQFVYTVTPPNKRALDGAVLAERVRKLGKPAIFCETMREAARCALEEIGETGVIVAFGSLSYLAEMKVAFQKEKDEGNRKR